MNFLKTIVLSVLLIPIFLINAQSYEIYVSDLKTESLEYSVGDIIEGSFILYNVKETPQSDVYYYIHTGLYSENGVDLNNSIGVSKKVGPIYLNGNSNKNISFSYKLPDSISGKAGIEVVAELKDGTVVGWRNTDILINGEVENITIPIVDTSLVVNDESFGVGTGPTILEEDTISLSYTLPVTNYEQSLTPSIKLFNRVYNSDVIYEEVYPSVTTSATEDLEYIIQLPKDLDPLVYAGMLSLSGDGVSTSDVFFRYIIGGDIATIRNVNSDKLSVKKDEEFITTIEYSGVPLDITNPEKQINLEDIELSIEVSGTDGLVAEYVGDIDLKKQTVSIPLIALSDSDELSYNVVLSKEDKILSEYETILDTKGLESFDKSSGELYLVLMIYLAAIILAMIIIFLVVTKKHKDVAILPLLIVLFGLSIGGGFIVHGFVIDSESGGAAIDYWDSDGHIDNIVLSSPEPSSYKTYETGEEFFLSVSASVLACLNLDTFLGVYGPTSSNWVGFKKTTIDEYKNGGVYKETFQDEMCEDSSTRSGRQDCEEVYVYSPFPVTTVGPFYAPDTPGTYDFNFALRGSTTYTTELVGRAVHDIFLHQEIKVAAPIVETPDPTISCSVSPSSPTEGSTVTFTASAQNVPNGVTPIYTWTDGGVSNIGDNYVVNNIPNGNYQVELNSDIGGTVYGPKICTAVVSVGGTCSENDEDPCGLDCNNDGILDGKIQCNGVCDDTRTSCDNPGVTNSCDFLPEHVTSTTYNIFNKMGEFVLVDSDTSDSKTSKDFFDQYFRTILEQGIIEYNLERGNIQAITLEDIGGVPQLSRIPKVEGEIDYDLAVFANIDASCNIEICDLNPVYYNTGLGNKACSILKEGQELSSNGCYNPNGPTALKLLTSPNYMDPGEYCDITWCAQGPGAQSCVLIVDNVPVTTGMSGTFSNLMGNKSENVTLRCNDGYNGPLSERTGECKLHPDWNQF